MKPFTSLVGMALAPIALFNACTGTEVEPAEAAVRTVGSVPTGPSQQTEQPMAALSSVPSSDEEGPMLPETAPPLSLTGGAGGAGGEAVATGGNVAAAVGGGGSSGAGLAGAGGEAAVPRAGAANAGAGGLGGASGAPSLEMEPPQGAGTGGMAAGAGGMAPGAAGAALMEAEITLQGEPPPPQEFSSGEDFDLLPADENFSAFEKERDRVQVLPLRDINWPADFDWPRAPGRDEELNEKHLWARAALPQTLKEWYYDVELDYCGEGDGESPFALAVNGVNVRELSPPPGGNNTCSRQTHVWERVAIPADAKIEIRAKSHSNLEHPEGASGRQYDCNDCTFAWARGRWHTVTFTPAQ